MLKIELLPHTTPGHWRVLIDGIDSRDGTTSPPFTRHGADLAARAAISAWSKALDLKEKETTPRSSK